MLNLQKLREDYCLQSLDLNTLHSDPFEQFKKWFEEALASQIKEPNAMALATVSEEGHPSCRMVLLKEFNEMGLIFFTNYESRKGKQIEKHPFAAVTFFWAELERQVRVEGKIEKTSRECSENYFHQRPRDSQISTWVSHQSDIIDSPDELIDKFKACQHEFEGQTIPLPPYWGGYLLKPTFFEFWQGRPNRLHDRFRYLLKDRWQIDRLSP